MAHRNELSIRANAVGLDPTQNKYSNDSKLEQKVLWLEKRATAFSGTLGAGTMTNDGTQSTAGDTISIGAFTYTYVTALTETVASSTLTVASEPSDGDIVSVGGISYTFRTALTNTTGAPYEVLIGGSASAACTNLGYAIAGTGGTPGTNYGPVIANPLVTVGTVTASTVPVTASTTVYPASNYAGGNQVQTSVAVGTAETWTGAFLSGGVNSPSEVPVAPVQASATITNNGTNVSDADTVTVNGQAYRFKTTMAAAYDVQIGTTNLLSMANLALAINATGVAGTNYYTGTLALPNIGASLSASSLVVTVTAITPGTAGNAYTLAKSSTNTSVSGAVFTGGVNALTYQIVLGASVSAQMTNTKNAINGVAADYGVTISTGIPAHPQVTATSGATTVVLAGIDYAITNGSVSTLTPINTATVNAWGGTVLASGVGKVIAPVLTTQGASGISGDANVTDSNI
jgi:hypothetical protein